MEPLKRGAVRADASCMTTLRRFFRRTAAVDRSTWRAGQDVFPAVMMSPRVWVALG